MAVKLTNQLVRIPEGCSIVRANVFEDYDELIISRPIPEDPPVTIATIPISHLFFLRPALKQRYLFS